MDWAGKQHPAETLLEWLAPAALAGAAGWAVFKLGLAQPATLLVGVAIFLAGVLVMRMIGREGEVATPSFEPAAFDEMAAEPDELLLDNPLIDSAEADELLLDDPLTDIGDDARVVRLFARQEPTPGELVARIEDFLGDGTRRAAARAEPVAVPDAGAALHAALANVRASLK